MDGRMPGQEPRGLLGQKLSQLRHRGVGELGQVELGQTPVGVDHIEGRRVVDLSGLDLHPDVVGVPDPLEPGQRCGEEAPLVDHPVRLRVGAHVPHRRGRGVGVDAEQGDLRSRRAEHLLGLDHRGRGQRTDGRALGVVEGEQHHPAAQAVQRDGTIELVGQSEARSGAGKRLAGVERGIGNQRVGADRRPVLWSQPGHRARPRPRSERWRGSPTWTGKMTAGRGRLLVRRAFGNGPVRWLPATGSYRVAPLRSVSRACRLPRRSAGAGPSSAPGRSVSR